MENSQCQREHLKNIEKINRLRKKLKKNAKYLIDAENKNGRRI
jgi:uncharacterized FlaG/YvyC family protein